LLSNAFVSLLVKRSDEGAFGSLLVVLLLHLFYKSRLFYMALYLNFGKFVKPTTESLDRRFGFHELVKGKCLGDIIIDTIVNINFIV
jgi:hypothetical protein